MAINLSINKVYTFSTQSPAILGATIKNAKLLYSCGFEYAMKVENVAVKYAAVYPSLPAGTPQNPAGVVFYRFKAENGDEIFIAEPWIVDGSVVQVDYIDFVISVVNSTPDEKAKIIAALNLIGATYTTQQS